MPVVGKSVDGSNADAETTNANKSGKSKPVAPPRKEKNGIFRSSKSSGNLDPSRDQCY